MQDSSLDQGPDRRRTLAVAEDAQRIADLAEELQRNALELGGQSQKLRGTLEALEAATEALDRRTAETALAQTIADAATARLARLQSITAALSNTVTQDGVAESVLREAIVALECQAGAVVVSIGEDSEGLGLLREAGALDPIMRSFAHAHSPESRGPYSDAVRERRSDLSGIARRDAGPVPVVRGGQRGRVARGVDISPARDWRNGGGRSGVRLRQPAPVHAAGHAFRRDRVPLLRTGSGSRQASRRRRVRARRGARSTDDGGAREQRQDALSALHQSRASHAAPRHRGLHGNPGVGNPGSRQSGAEQGPGAHQARGRLSSCA